MKIFVLTIFLVNLLFGNYAYENNNKGKIDMHGGKGDSLIGNKSSFSNSNFNSFQNGLGLKNYDSTKNKSVNNNKKDSNQNNGK